MIESYLIHLQLNDIEFAGKYACSSCWSEVESFHNFYVMVEANYQNERNQIDVKVDPLFEHDPQTTVDESVIGDIPPTTYLNESTGQIESFKNENETISLTVDQAISDSNTNQISGVKINTESILQEKFK